MALEIVETLFRGICVGVAASITVGPVAVLCIQRTLSKSRRSGIVSGIGVACADTFMAMAALFFYSMLQTQIEQYNTLLRQADDAVVLDNSHMTVDEQMAWFMEELAKVCK